MRNGARYMLACRMGQVISQPGWKASARQSSMAAWSSMAGCSCSGTSASWAGYCWPGFQSDRSEEHTSELQSQSNLVCRLLLEKKNRPEDGAAEVRAAPVERHHGAGIEPDHEDLAPTVGGRQRAGLAGRQLDALRETDHLERPGLGEPLPDPFAAQGEHCGCPGGLEEAPAIKATLVRQRDGERVSLLQHSASSRCRSAGVRGGGSARVTARTR